MAPALWTKKLSKTRREQLRHDTDEAIRHLMIGITAQPMVLLYLVASGPDCFRQRFLREFRGLMVNRHVADLVFKFFCEQVVAKYGPAVNPKMELERMEREYKAPPTEAEIERAWVHEIAGSEEARRRFYADRDTQDKVIIH